MGLNKMQMQIARNASGFSLPTALKSVYAAVEAVLAEQARAAEQPICGYCNDTGEICFSSSSYGPCPDCAKRHKEQARAAEQGQQFTDDRVQTPSDELLMRYVENHLSVMGAFPNPPCNCRLHRALLAIGQPTQPPAGDEVERMCEVFCNTPPVTDNNEGIRKGMAAALAVAREGYVNLDDVEKAIREFFDSFRGWSVESPSDCTGIIMATIRNRLAKPAEQADEQKVEAILRRDWSKNGITYPQLAAEIVAALKEGKQ